MHWGHKSRKNKILNFPIKSLERFNELFSQENNIIGKEVVFFVFPLFGAGKLKDRGRNTEHTRRWFAQRRHTCTPNQYTMTQGSGLLDWDTRSCKRPVYQVRGLSIWSYLLLWVTWTPFCGLQANGVQGRRRFKKPEVMGRVGFGGWGVSLIIWVGLPGWMRELETSGKKNNCMQH